MKHILVVDDNKSNLMMAKMTLQEDYKVTAVPMGAQALKFLESNTCDILLLDIDMPQMDGFEVLAKMKEMNLPKEPIVLFLTANNQPDVLEKCIDDGGMDVVLKPFVQKVLKSRISYLLELADYRAAENV